MGDITSANTISLLRVLQKEPGWKVESLSEASKHASQVFACFCRLAAGLTDSGGWADLGIRSRGPGLILATRSLDDHELGLLLPGASVYFCAN